MATTTKTTTAAVAVSVGDTADKGLVKSFTTTKTSGDGNPPPNTQGKGRSGPPGGGGSGPPGGGGGSDGGGGGAGGGGAANQGGGGGGKLGGNPPSEFNGDQALVDTFINEFNLYHLTNVDTVQMVLPMKRADLFLGFIKGPNVKDWVKKWTNWTITQVTQGRPLNNEYYWDQVFGGFQQAFQDTGARE